MNLHLRTALAALGLVAVAPLGGGPATSASAAPLAVLELFTSQGCNSCPPADALLAELAKRPDLIALTLPVDYWDYLGWKDTLAQPAFSGRQRAYAAVRADRAVYTPQIVVNGLVHCVGSNAGEVERSIAKGAQGRAALPVEVTLAEADDRVTVSVAGGAGTAEVWLLPVSRAETVPIGRGENRGRTITYANVVRSMIRLGDWRGAPTNYAIPLAEARAGADGYVVLLQEASPGKPGAIRGAAKSAGL